MIFQRAGVFMLADGIIVTTAHKNSPLQKAVAGEIAYRLKLPYVERGGRSLSGLCAAHGAAGAVVAAENKISFVSGGQEFYFHHGLAILRIKELNNGKNDQMIEAMCLKPGYRVLDCTLGLGADAIVASFASGEEGQVVGLEKSPVIAEIVRHGLSLYTTGEEAVDRAMRRIKVIWADYRDFLPAVSPGSFDIVYFDPMFRRPRFGSPSMNTMRSLAAPDPLDREVLAAAARAAARRVVVKERRGSSEFARLGIKEIRGGRYAPVAYGVLEGSGGGK